MHFDGVPVERVDAAVYTVRTETPEQDGTFDWDRTTVLVVEVHAAGKTGLGYSYTCAAAARVVTETLAPILIDKDAFAIPSHWKAMLRSVRNFGSRGVCANAIAAVDVALWDLKARLLDVPLAQLFGMIRASVSIYGSGGFTNYTDQQLHEQLGGWTHVDGCCSVKMKIGRDARRDEERMRVPRSAIGSAALMTDANGAFDLK